MEELGVDKMQIKYWLLHQAMQRGRNKVRKKEPLIGQHFTVPRSGAKSVETFLYRPEKAISKSLPTLFNVHGGAWVGGDATTLDSQSQYIADRLGCFVVNINYTKLDVEPFPYPQQEIRDTVLYFRNHAKEYGIDITRFSLIGYSAGGHLCAGTAILLRDAGFQLNSQFLCYPFLDFTNFGMEGMGMEQGKAEKTDKLMDGLFFPKMGKATSLLSPAAAPKEILKGLAAAEIITCGEDELLSQSVQYEEHLTKAGVEVLRKDYRGSIHGFLEVNFPETKENGAKSLEQEAFMKEAFEYICQRAFYHWNIQTD